MYFFFKQKTAYEMRISDWSSDVCSSDLGRRVDEASPYVDARLPDGSRVNIVIPPVALDGPMVSIRKLKRQQMSAQDFVQSGAMSAEMLDFLADADGADHLQGGRHSRGSDPPEQPARHLPQLLQSSRARSEERRVGKEGASTCS